MIGEATVALPLEGVIDMEAERKRLSKEIEKAESDRNKAVAWLGNEANVAKSPEHVVELNRERVTEGTDRIARLQAAQLRLGTLGQARQPGEELQVAPEGQLDARAQHLDRHLLARPAILLAGDGEVDLRHGGGGDRRLVEGLEELLQRRLELGLVGRLNDLVGGGVPDDAILIDIPKPEKWRTDVWVEFSNPPVGMQRLMPWRTVVGLGDEELKRYEEHRRLIRLVVAEPYRERLRQEWERLLYPLIGGMV